MAGSLSNEFEMSRRRNKLTWGHHLEVQALLNLFLGALEMTLGGDRKSNQSANLHSDTFLIVTPILDVIHRHIRTSVLGGDRCQKEGTFDLTHSVTGVRLWDHSLKQSTVER